MRNTTRLSPAVVLALSLCARSQTLPAAQSSPDLNDLSAVATLQRDLASDDYQTRERAQALLNRVGVAGKPELQKLAAQTADPEVQARLLARIEMLEEIQATDPPRISVDVSNISLTRITQELTRALGSPVANSGVNDVYSLKVKDASFPEVLQILNQQHPLWFTSTQQLGIRISRLTGVWETSMAYRGFGIFLRDGSLPVPAGAARAGVGARGVIAPATRSFIFGVAIDPRINMVQYNGLEIASITDDARNQWVWLPIGAPSISLSNPRPSSITHTLQLLEPDHPGHQITSVRGQLSVVVALDEDRVEIGNISQQLNTPIKAGQCEITFQDATITEPAPGTRILQMQMTCRPPTGATTPRPSSQTSAILSVVDANNQEVFTRAFQLGSPLAMSTSTRFTGREPIKIIITAPKRTKAVTIPFEFKNVRIPGS